MAANLYETYIRNPYAEENIYRLISARYAQRAFNFQQTLDNLYS